MPFVALLMGATQNVNSALSPTNKIYHSYQTLENNTIIPSISPNLTPGTPFQVKNDIRYLIVEKMAICESSNNPSAINPNDLDNTPSYGRFQFKPTTLLHFVNKYKLADTTGWDIIDATNWCFDGQFTEKIFRKMLDDKSVNFSTEFPACFKKNKLLFEKYWNL